VTWGRRGCRRWRKIYIWERRERWWLVFDGGEEDGVVARFSLVLFLFV